MTKEEFLGYTDYGDWRMVRYTTRDTLGVPHIWDVIGLVLSNQPGLAPSETGVIVYQKNGIYTGISFKYIIAVA